MWLAVTDRRSDCPETSVNNYKSTPRNVSEEQIPHLKCGGTTRLYQRYSYTLGSNYVTYIRYHTSSHPKVDIGLRTLKINWLIIHTWLADSRTFGVLRTLTVGQAHQVHTGPRWGNQYRPVPAVDHHDRRQFTEAARWCRTGNQQTISSYTLLGTDVLSWWVFTGAPTRVSRPHHKVLTRTDLTESQWLMALCL